MTQLSVWIARHPIGTLSGLFGFCVTVFLLSIPLPRADNMLIGSDGIRYYSYTRSLVIDHDLDFTNEFQRLRPRGLQPTAAGRPANTLPIGTGLVWVPSFLLAHVVVRFLGLPADGYGYPYQAAACLGSMFYGFIGLLASYRLCREFADALSSVVAVALIWFAGNVVYYMVVEPSMSHMASLAAVSAFLAWWRLYPRRDVVYWIGVGALGGLAALIRPQDGLFLLLPAVQWLVETGRLVFGRRWHGLWPQAGRAALVIGAMAAVYSIQLWAWAAVFGSATARPSDALAHFAWFRPHVREVLVSPFHGLFVWHPIYLVGVLGLWWVARQARAYAGLLLLGFAVQVYLVASWAVWWQGDAFGGRMLICSVPIVAIGLAQVVQHLRRLHWLAVALPATLLLLWNLTFFVQYRFGFIPKGDPISWEQVLQGKLTLPGDVWRRWTR